jgi:hypothetical protein
MARLMRSLPELVTMTKAMMMSSRAVSSSLLMVAMLIYVFAIVMHMSLSQEEEVAKHFKTLPLCMWTLLIDGTFMDSTGSLLTKLLNMAQFNTIVGLFVFLLFILLSAMTVMNMLIGIICEVVSAVGQAEKDEAAIRAVKETILLELMKFDDGDGKISREELAAVMNDKTSRAVLKSLNVDPFFLDEMQDLLLPTVTSTMPLKSIMELVLTCRGDLPTTVQHLARAQMYMTANLTKHQEFMTQYLAKTNYRTEAHIMSRFNGMEAQIISSLNALVMMSKQNSRALADEFRL